MPTCYHCNLPIPEGLHLTVIINNKPQSMCCAGCQAVAQAIVQAGLQDFYTYRTDSSPTGRELVPEFLQKTTVYDNPAIQRRFVQIGEGNLREAALILEGITCAACIWLNEHHLRNLPGVLEVSVNYTTHRAQVRWDDSRIHLSEILQAISRIGYLAHPYDPARQQDLLERERKQQLRRIGVAGVLGMQIMMFSVALYVGAWSGIETEFKVMFYWVNLFLTIPILLYSAEPFFKSAWRDLQNRSAGMDVPVSLGISLAFVGSVWTTLSGSEGHVYYDSIAMFVFLLLTGRYFELMARHRSNQAAESLVHLIPTMATRLRQTEQGHIEELVLVADLEIENIVLIKPGETIPTDGIVIAGHANVDESLLTGESHPIAKTIGQPLIGGTINMDSPLQMQVTKIGTDTVLSHIIRLLERAQTEKPALTQLADHVATWFVLGVIVLAIGVATYWWQADSQVWLDITLAVLVVTCPCALSLATPTAITAATSTLTRVGLLVTRGHALETLARADHFIFDKTGTLTEGKLDLLKTQVFSTFTIVECLNYAVALERHSEHPIARTLIIAGENSFPEPVERKIFLTAKNVTNHPGSGIQGDILGKRYFIGTPAFIAEQTQLSLNTEQLQLLQRDGHTVVLISDKYTIHAAFVLGDKIRTGAKDLVTVLKQQGKLVSLFTGDHATAAQQVAQAVGIEDIGYALTPADKLQKVKALQAKGAIVAMIGDGVNDAPVLAQAQVSIAMGSGTQVARASADMILLSEQLPNLLLGIYTAQKTLQIIQQNVWWAVGYNVLALPAAAIGLVAPWLAAIGMSLSSLLVVANALRLVKTQRDL